MFRARDTNVGSYAVPSLPRALTAALAKRVPVGSFTPERVWKTLNALKSVSTLTDLAILLNYKPAALAYILYKTVPAAKYTTFTIPKKSGGQRTIDAPIPQLKVCNKSLPRCCRTFGTKSNRRTNAETRSRTASVAAAPSSPTPEAPQ